MIDINKLQSEDSKIIAIALNEQEQKLIQLEEQLKIVEAKVG